MATLAKPTPTAVPTPTAPNSPEHTGKLAAGVHASTAVKKKTLKKWTIDEENFVIAEVAKLSASSAGEVDWGSVIEAFREQFDIEDDVHLSKTGFSGRYKRVSNRRGEETATLEASRTAAALLHLAPVAKTETKTEATAMPAPHQPQPPLPNPAVMQMVQMPGLMQMAQSMMVQNVELEYRWIDPINGMTMSAQAGPLPARQLCERGPPAIYNIAAGFEPGPTVTLQPFKVEPTGTSNHARILCVCVPTAPMTTIQKGPHPTRMLL